MKNEKFNKKTVVLATLILLFVLLLLIFVLFGGQSFSANAKFKEHINEEYYLNQIVLKMFGKKISSVDTWYNLDDTPEYIYVEFCDGGYAVFYSTLELLEFSNSGRYIDINTKEKVYYTGPTNVFYKKNNNFQNLITGENKRIISQEANQIAKKIRHKFLKNDFQINISNIDNIFNAQHSYSSPPIDTSDLIIMDTNAETYIENRSYFLNDPYHGDNEHGTCGSVAAQLLLGYNNYYVDRRIIANNHLYSGASNPNTCSDPMSMSSQVLGSNDTYYNYIISEVEPTALNCVHTIGDHGEIIHSHTGSYCSDVKNGLHSILNARGISYNISGTVYSNQLPVNVVVNSIDNDKPLIISLSSDNGAINHWVVAYGYRNYTYPNDGGTYTGYITHFGWSSNGNEYAANVWVNSSWCDGYVSLNVNHIHDYTEYIGGEYHEVRCSSCGHRKYAYEINYLSIDEVEIGQTEFAIDGFIRLPNLINGHTVTKIGDYAFSDQTELTGISLPAQLQVIGCAAFNLCTSLTSIIIPDTVVEICEGAFSWTSSLSEIIIPESVNKIEAETFGASGINKFTAKGRISKIGTSAFALCGNLKSVYLQPNMILMEEYAFYYCNSLPAISLLGNMTCIKDNAFLNCNNLTIYLSKNNTNNFGDNWNPSNRPVIFGCNRENNVIVSFVKSSNNPINSTADNGILNPKREGYAFGGWYTTSNYSGTKYINIATAPNGTLYAKWEIGNDDNLTGEGTACVAEGSLITLADGTQKAVEDLTGNEMLLVWDLFNGTFSAAPILFIDSDPMRAYEVITLTFADGTEVKVIDEHGFWNVDLNEYVFLRADAAKYIGDTFNKQIVDANGNMTYTAVELVSVSIATEYTTAWSPVTYGHLCYYVNGMLSMPGATTGLINIFEVDPDTMKIDEEAYAEDIAEYGVYTYEEFTEEIAEVPETIFNAFGGAYLKVAIGKGILTEDMILELISRYSEFFD